MWLRSPRLWEQQIHHWVWQEGDFDVCGFCRVVGMKALHGRNWGCYYLGAYFFKALVAWITDRMWNEERESAGQFVSMKEIEHIMREMGGNQDLSGQSKKDLREAVMSWKISCLSWSLKSQYRLASWVRGKEESSRHSEHKKQATDFR